MAAGNGQPSWFKPDTRPEIRTYLVFTDLAKGAAGSNKEIMAELFVNGPECFRRTRYGKVGSVDAGTATEEWRPSSEKEYQKYIAGKCKAGRDSGCYRIVPLADKAAPAVVQRAILPIVQRILDLASNRAREVLAANTSVRDLTDEQLDKADALLQTIAGLLSASKIDRPAVIAASNDFFMALPHSTGSGQLQIPRLIRDPWEAAITSLKRVEAEHDAVEDIRSARKSAQTPVTQTSTLALLGAELEPVDAAELKRLTEWVRETHAGTHHFKLGVKAAWKVSNPTTDAAFVGGKNCMDLFHGSRDSNTAGICQRGILIKPAGIPTVGSMFGNGAYFADKSSKSAQYAGDFMFVAEVALGKMYSAKDDRPQKPPAGYDSVKGCAGGRSGLLYNEFIVYQVNRSTLRFLLELDHPTGRRY